MDFGRPGPGSGGQTAESGLKHFKCHDLKQVSLPDKLRPDRAARPQPETRNRRRELLAIPYRRKSAIQSFGERGEQEAEDARELPTVHSK